MEVVSLGGFTVYGLGRVDVCSNPVYLSSLPPVPIESLYHYFLILPFFVQ